MTPSVTRHRTEFMSLTTRALFRMLSATCVLSLLAVSAWGQRRPESNGVRIPDVNSLTETALFRDIDRRIESGQGDSRLITRDGWQRDYPFNSSNDADVSRDTRGRELLYLRHEDGIDFFEDVNSNELYASPRSLAFSSLRALPEWIRRKLIRGGRRLPIDIRPRVYLNLDTGAREVGARIGLTALGSGVYREQLYELDGAQTNLVDANQVREFLGRPVDRPAAGNLPVVRGEETRSPQPDIVDYVRRMASDPRIDSTNRPAESGSPQEDSATQQTGRSQSLSSSTPANQGAGSGTASPSDPDVNHAAAEARRAVEQLYQERSRSGDEGNPSRTESETQRPQSPQERLLQVVRDASRLREQAESAQNNQVRENELQETRPQPDFIPDRQRSRPDHSDARPGDYYRIGTPDGVRYYDWQGNRIPGHPGMFRQNMPGPAENDPGSNVRPITPQSRRDRLDSPLNSTQERQVQDNNGGLYAVSSVRNQWDRSRQNVSDETQIESPVQTVVDTTPTESGSMNPSAYRQTVARREAGMTSETASIRIP